MRKQRPPFTPKTKTPAQKPDKATRYTIEQPDELMKFLLEKLAHKGRNTVKGILSRGQVSVNGKKTTRHDHALAPGDVLTIQWNITAEEDKPLGLHILHEDEDMIVINKEAGMLSIAGGEEKELTAYWQLTEHVRRSDPKSRIFVVHRLDRDTSGVMLFAKTEKAQQTLQNAWQEAVHERSYVALVERKVKQPEGTITSWLKESKTLLMYSSPVNNGGLKAVTHYKVLQNSSDYSLLEVQLETGRKNQIRVHMQDLGHPVVGDKKYGSTRNTIGRLGLHARVISFEHPTTGKLMRFETAIPGKFLRVFAPKA
ncbi:RluA family pseudouridine synthase [Paenibacillus sp. FJAT-26967]|uniref:RluA family pseudouridine synthase n=1 Tax=Paenibacillus sp. FJAT-26967 TaxID=1729690 RepID=UPI000838BD80|nr:RluA family pseudouridine synthase [Paenibacillus sp. FJAT-26967]